MIKESHYLSFGILGILLLSLGVVNAVSENGFTILVAGAGESTSNRISGNPDSMVSFNILFNNSNETYQDAILRISGINIVSVNKSVIGNETFSVDFVIPQTQETLSRIVTAKVYDSTNTILLGTVTDNVYYNVTFLNDGGLSCIAGEKGDLEIPYFSVNNLGTGDDEEWDLLDEIEIEVEVENNNRNDRISDVIVEIKILNDDGDDVTEDFNLDDEEIDLGRIGKRESEIALFRIPELPADLEEGVYRIYIKAYSENDEDSQCVSTSNDFNKDDYNEIEIVREDDPAVIVKSDVIRMPVLCGDKDVVVSYDIYNIGSDDEKRVLVVFENTELGISEKQVISNLRSGKKTEVTFVFDLPDYLPKKIYDISVTTYFDYNKGDELSTSSYDESSDEISRRFSTRLEILDCKTPEPTINARLDSEAKVNENLVVRINVKNNAGDTKNFIISAEGYESWGNIVSIEPASDSIAGGQSKDFLITFVPEKSGTQSFKISVIAGNETYEQPFSVSISGKKSLFDFGLDNLSLYLLIGIGILIILILIVLIVRVFSHGKRD
jgi:hypothetical protein